MAAGRYQGHRQERSDQNYQERRPLERQRRDPSLGAHQGAQPKPDPGQADQAADQRQGGRRHTRPQLLKPSSLGQLAANQAGLAGIGGLLAAHGDQRHPGGGRGQDQHRQDLTASPNLPEKRRRHRGPVRAHTKGGSQDRDVAEEGAQAEHPGDRDQGRQQQQHRPPRQSPGRPQLIDRLHPLVPPQ